VLCGNDRAPSLAGVDRSQARYQTLLYVVYGVILAVGLACVLVGSYAYITYLVAALFCFIFPTFCWGAYKIQTVLKAARGLDHTLRLIQQTAVGVVVTFTVFVGSSVVYGATGGAKSATPFNSVPDKISGVIWVSGAGVILVVQRYTAMAVWHKVRGSSSTVAASSSHDVKHGRMGPDGGRQIAAVSLPTTAHTSQASAS